MDLKKTLSVILLAAGKGLRMGSSVPKQFLPLHGKPVAVHSLDMFQSLELATQEIIVVCEPAYRSLFQTTLKPLTFALPGSTRQESVRNGFHALTTPSDVILIHDTARPLIESKDIYALVHQGHSIGAATLACPVSATIKQANADLFVNTTLPRESLWEIQTPQLLSYALLKQGLDYVAQHKLTVTDDVSLAELLGHPVKLVQGSPTNFKITHPVDLERASSVLKHRLRFHEPL